VVAYLSRVNRGTRTIYIISLGRVVGVFRPLGWKRAREPSQEEMEVGAGLLSNSRIMI
jgi:hypothetical protein